MGVAFSEFEQRCAFEQVRIGLSWRCQDLTDLGIAPILVVCPSREVGRGVAPATQSIAKTMRRSSMTIFLGF